MPSNRKTIIILHDFFGIMKSSLSSILNTFKKIPSLYYKLVFAFVFAFIISAFKFDSIEFFLFDIRTIFKAKLGLAVPTFNNIVLVYTDHNTVEKYNKLPDFKLHTLFLKKVSLAKNSQVLYNYRIDENQFAEISGNYEEKYEFTKTASQNKQLYFLINNLALKGQESSLKLSVPLDTLNVTPAPRTNDTQLNLKNSISRRILIDYEEQFLIHQKIASIYNPEIKTLQNVNGQYTHIGTNQVYITFSPPGSFKTFKFEDIIEDKIPISELENKIILIGTDTHKSVEDYTSTPYSSETQDMITTTELQANMFNTLIENNAPIRPPRVMDIVLTMLISVLTVFVALSSKPSRGIIILISAFTGLILISTALLAFFNIWINLAHPLLAIFLCYYFFIPYRLIIENRRSWEYQQKNKLLHQVEELKTNFISMMSHDLKTPIARIQGMTEVILKDEVQLSSTQREAVDTIKSSSDDLLKFINSILQYGRIESQGVELQKKSKDINQLLQEVIKKHEFLARLKRIKILTELEPMFPISVDSDLMKQVFSNLIENAIKYSHEDSVITVKSSDQGDKIHVEVVDNGMGIPSEDLPNIFMKFYRSQNVKTSTIKGTGLGLYLAHYFVKLHKGDIQVISEHQKGSTFTVVLPLNS